MIKLNMTILKAISFWIIQRIVNKDILNKINMTFTHQHQNTVYNV